MVGVQQDAEIRRMVSVHGPSPARDRSAAGARSDTVAKALRSDQPPWHVRVDHASADAAHRPSGLTPALPAMRWSAAPGDHRRHSAGTHLIYISRNCVLELQTYR